MKRKKKKPHKDIGLYTLLFLSGGHEAIFAYIQAKAKKMVKEMRTNAAY
jgi:hypothetical protein